MQSSTASPQSLTRLHNAQFNNYPSAVTGLAARGDDSADEVQISRLTNELRTSSVAFESNQALTTTQQTSVISDATNDVPSNAPRKCQPTQPAQAVRHESNENSRLPFSQPELSSASLASGAPSTQLNTNISAPSISKQQDVTTHNKSPSELSTPTAERTPIAESVRSSVVSVAAQSDKDIRDPPIRRPAPKRPNGSLASTTQSLGTSILANNCEHHRACFNPSQSLIFDISFSCDEIRHHDCNANWRCSGGTNRRI